MSVYVNMYACDENDECVLSPPQSTLMAWLYIEMYCFYIYMFAAILYISYHQLVEGVCFKKQREQSDMNKTINDFIQYTYENLIWFALNTVLILMPVVCILTLNSKAENLDIEGAEMSYTSLLTIVCLANLLQFCLRPRLYTHEKKSQLYTIEPKAEVAPSKIGGMNLGGMLSGLKQEKQASSGKKDMGQEEKDLIRDGNDDDHHYVWMQARFNEDRLWVWIVNLVAYIAVITTYFCVDGHEIIYSIYLPLDVMLNISKAIFFFGIYWVDRREKAKREELQKALKQGV